MKVIPADSSNDNVMIIGIPKDDDSSNAGLPSGVILIISKFIMQVLTVPETNPKTTVFLFLVNMYKDNATMNPAIIEGIRKGKINKPKIVGRKAINLDVLKSRLTFELLITIVFVSYCGFENSFHASTLTSYSPFGSIKEYDPLGLVVSKELSSSLAP